MMNEERLMKISARRAKLKAEAENAKLRLQFYDAFGCVPDIVNGTEGEARVGTIVFTRNLRIAGNLSWTAKWRCTRCGESVVGNISGLATLDKYFCAIDKHKEFCGGKF